MPRFSPEWWTFWAGVSAVVLTAGAAAAGVVSWYFGLSVAENNERRSRATEQTVAEAKKSADEARTAYESQRERTAKAERDAAAANEQAQAIALRLSEQQERTAKAEARVLELEQRNEPRRISESVFTRLVENLRASPHKGQVTVAMVIGDPEVAAFAARLSAALTEAGWQVSRGVLAEISGRGLGVVVRDRFKAPPHAAALQRAFNESGIPLDGTTSQIVGDNSVMLFVGTKP